MLTKELYEKYSAEAVKYLEKAHIAIIDEEKANIEVVKTILSALGKGGFSFIK